MGKKSKIIFLGLSIVIYMTACKSKTSDQEVEQKLSAAMSKNLNANHLADSLHTTFDILDVNFYEEKTLYHCEFKVHLKNPTKDTTGIMTADISKDFERVIRKN
jgi:glycine cleavage system protein P-like pyridoxal-binding family